MKPLKLILVFGGAILAIIALIGYFLIDYCETSPEDLAQGVEGVVSEPLTISMLAMIGGVISAIAGFFIALLCPILAFLNSLLPLYWFIIIGVLTAIIGWYVVPI